MGVVVRGLTEEKILSLLRGTTGKDGDLDDSDISDGLTRVEEVGDELGDTWNTRNSLANASLVDLRATGVRRFEGKVLARCLGV